jgi:hydroxymethylglutaryl-CoA reductase
VSKPKLRDLPAAERAATLGLPDADLTALQTGLSLDQADHMIENVIATYALPMGIAQNFVINGREIPAIPMVVEEASIVAACSYAAKLVRSTGGFIAHSTAPIMIGQIQTLGVTDVAAARERIAAETESLINWLNNHNPSTQSRHARAIGVETRAVADMLIVHVLYDCGDAMGANLINTACEALAPKIEALTGGEVYLRILSNLSDRRLASARCTIRMADVLPDGSADERAHAARAIFEAGRFAELDPYRATTHNKGVMNGIDAVALATGNDWRAIEAAAHAYVARDGRYTAMTRWRLNPDGDLTGEIELPMAVGTVGGATRVHPGAQAALKLLGMPGARALAEIMVCVGLAQNFAAIRALAMEGIQNGHMRLHARQIAVAAGASGEQVERIAAQLVTERNVRLARAQELLAGSDTESAAG